MDQIYKYDDYAHYVEVQRSTSIARRAHTLARVGVTRGVAKWLRIRYPRLNSVLCVGARDSSEVRCFRELGFAAMGIDLHESLAIVRCDMSKIPADPRFGGKTFDIAFCSHSLEHCLDFPGFYQGLRFLNVRVVYCECPILAKPDQRECHRYDFMSKDCSDSDLLKYFGDYVVDARFLKGNRIAFCLRDETCDVDKTVGSRP